MKKTKKIALLGLLSSLALVLSYLESLLPPLSATLPGIKMGLPNIIIILVLYRFGLPDAITVSAVRLLTVALLFGNTMTLAYSVAGAVLSLAVMALLKNWNRFSTVGVSVAGGVFHNLGQILMAMLLLGTKTVGYYMIVLTATGTVAGLLVGLAGNSLLHFFDKHKFQ